jgi:hypothetical protein
MKTVEEQELRHLWRAVRNSAGGLSRKRLLEIVGEPDIETLGRRIVERYPAMESYFQLGPDVGELDERDQDG